MQTEVHGRPLKEKVLSQLWAKYFPFWPFYLVLMTIAAGGAWLYQKSRLPQYEATATLLIKDEKKGIQDAKMVQSIDLLTTKKIIENEVEIIKSRTLVNQVVDNLALYAPVFEDTDWHKTPVYTQSPIKIEIQSPDSLIEVQRVNFVYDPSNRTVQFDNQTVRLNEWVDTQWGKLKFTEKSPRSQPTGQLYFSLIEPRKVVQDLIDRINVNTAGKLSSVLTLKFKDEIPQRAEAVLNNLIAAYDRESINDKNALALNTLTFLDERLGYISAGLDSIELALQQYRSGKGAIDLSEQGKLFLQNVSTNDQKLSDVNMKLTVLEQIERSIFTDNKITLVPTTLGTDQPVLTALLTKLYDLGLDYEKIKKTTGEANPQAIALQDQIQRLKPDILNNIISQRQSLEISKKNLSSTNNEYNSLLRALPKQERDLVEISRQQNIKTSIFTYLLQKKEEAALSHSSTVPDTRIVDKAQSSLNPVGIPGKVIYIAAVLLGLLFGIAFVELRELFNNKILYRHEIEAVTSFPVLAEISQVKSNSPLIIEHGDRTAIAEQFRLIRTSLPYLGVNGMGKKIFVTSTLPGEGKSFVALNLAMSLAIGGKNVVLVEFDLSNPTLGLKLDMKTGKGIADYLAGEVPADKIIIKSSQNENLFFIPAGTLPSNPSELILSQNTKTLLEYLEKIFDYVVVDSAPVGLVSDSYVLGRLCDATLYVVRHRQTPKNMLERLEKNNKINELKNIGLIFNGVRERGYGGSKYGYGYGFTKQDGYGKKKQRYY